MSMFWSRVRCFVGGFCVGKILYYPQYIPLPRIDREAVEHGLTELERLNNVVKHERPPSVDNP